MYICTKCGERTDFPAKRIRSSRIEKDEDGKTTIVSYEVIICKECNSRTTHNKPNIRTWKRE